MYDIMVIADARPKTGTSTLRSRRHKLAAARADEMMKNNNGSFRRMRLQHDESFDAVDDNQSPTREMGDVRLSSTPDRTKSHSLDMVRSPDPTVTVEEDDDSRPNSGPVVGSRGKFRWVYRNDLQLCFTQQSVLSTWVIHCSPEPMQMQTVPDLRG